MGDRCYVEITVRPEDEILWEALGYTSQEESDKCDGSLVMCDEERNYGVCCQPQDLVDDCPMIGWHGEGGDYGAHVFAWDGETFLDLPVMNDLTLVAEVDPVTCQAKEEHLKNIREFMAFLSKVQGMFDKKPEFCWPMTEEIAE